MTAPAPGPPIGAQERFSVRTEWGPHGASVIADGCAFAVVVDVLSFTTTLSVAADLGIDVVPCPVHDGQAETLAREHGATLARRRSQARAGEVSLSPGTLRTAGPLQRLVLPSPNGSTISSYLAGTGARVVGASLRNRTAVAAWLTEQAARSSGPARVAVVASGERWPDGSLRPAVEDLWGAGAVVSSLVEHGWRGLSPEAEAAAACFAAVREDVPGALHRCASGIELDDIGFGGDVDIAAELDRSAAVPVLVDGVYSAERLRLM